MSVAATRRWLAASGIDVRPGIEHDTLLMPWLIADSVVQECSAWLGVDLPDECSDWLDARAERLYANRRHFFQLIRRGGTQARSRLFMFMRHWLAAKLKRTQLRLYRRLPYTYSNGLPLPRHSRAA